MNLTDLEPLLSTYADGESVNLVDALLALREEFAGIVEAIRLHGDAIEAAGASVRAGLEALAQALRESGR